MAIAAAVAVAVAIAVVAAAAAAAAATAQQFNHGRQANNQGRNQLRHTAKSMNRRNAVQDP